MSIAKETTPTVLRGLLIAALWVGCVATALGVVYSSFKSRKFTQELELLRRESTQLQVASGQFLLEKSTWAAYSRVEKIAFEELGMEVPESEKTILVYKR
ncbi:cell division protein FtsL [Alteromonadaceae bacterium Bs31]|nr:cell division protein FtsL [Alteromonadaceae bacterium Bs31]